jgi:hypothetical protein
MDVLYYTLTDRTTLNLCVFLLCISLATLLPPPPHQGILTSPLRIIKRVSLTLPVSNPNDTITGIISVWISNQMSGKSNWELQQRNGICEQSSTCYFHYRSNPNMTTCQGLGQRNVFAGVNSTNQSELFARLARIILPLLSNCYS